MKLTGTLRHALRILQTTINDLLFRRTMLARVTNPNRNDTECQNTSFARHFGVYMLSDRAMASGFRGFVGRDSPGDNLTHVNRGYLLTLPEG